MPMALEHASGTAPGSCALAVRAVRISIRRSFLMSSLGDHRGCCRSPLGEAQGTSTCVEEAPDHVLGRDLLGLGLVGDGDPVAQHVGADGS